MEKYRVIISPKLIEQIKSIRDYVANVKLSPETAERLVTAIFDEIESLELFPERGFDADEKIGVKIDKNGRSSRGIIIQNGKYIVIYTVNQEEHLVEVAFLFSSNPNFKLKLATHKKFTRRLVVHALFRAIIHPMFDQRDFFQRRFLGSFWYPSPNQSIVIFIRSPLP